MTKANRERARVARQQIDSQPDGSGEWAARLAAGQSLSWMWRRGCQFECEYLQELVGISIGRPLSERLSMCASLCGSVTM